MWPSHTSERCVHLDTGNVSAIVRAPDAPETAVCERRFVYRFPFGSRGVRCPERTVSAVVSDWIVAERARAMWIVFTDHLGDVGRHSRFVPDGILLTVSLDPVVQVASKVEGSVLHRHSETSIGRHLSGGEHTFACVRRSIPSPMTVMITEILSVSPSDVADMAGWMLVMTRMNRGVSSSCSLSVFHSKRGVCNR